MSYGKLIKFEKQGKVGVIILDNAKRLNITGDEFFDELEEIQNEISVDNELGALAMVANGKNFSAGIDMKFLNSVSAEFMKKGLTRLQNLYSFWQELAIPIVAGIQGVCYGSGVELILGCDIRIAADNAKLCLPEVKFGLSPDMGGTTRLTKLVGIGQAKRIILSCEEVAAQEALNIGLVEKVVSVDELREYTIGFAKKMASYPSSGMRFAKKGINVAQESSVAASLLFEQAQSIYCCDTQDIKESTAAFIEKRKPNFIGK
ncbi:enoyl-CoA hydratase/isomerase family protein [Clostridium sediminicola]|uniref:enoyl-CoA hydratase/isomerase family protein n=1 Tax=Clostridium sediminicola TaxID=3114879 RepID=UPI0031F1EF51